MVKRIQVLFAMGLAMLACSCRKEVALTPFRLQCEYLVNPLGVDVNAPRLTWKLPDIPDIGEDSIYLYISTDSLAVANRAASSLYRKLPSQTNKTTYTSGLLPETTYYWRIATNQVFSEVASLTTVFSLAEAAWISDGNDQNYKASAFYKKEVLIDRTIKRAFWVIASAGLHELVINGMKVGNHYLDPMFTRFDKRILSVTHDVTSYLDEGKNELCVQLGNGWYNHQSTAVWFFDQAAWRSRPSFSSRLIIEYADGATESVLTDSTWQTADSPVIFNSIYTAEHYDARLEDKPLAWLPVKEVSPPTELIKSQLIAPVRAVEVINPSTMSKLNDSLYVYTFPRNIAGIIRLSVKGRENSVLRLKHGELLNSDGTVSTANIDYHYRPTDDADPFQEDIVILSGRTDTFEPKFNYKGFQYVEVSASEPLELKPSNLVALELHSDVPVKGTWHSSSAMLNKLWKVTNDTYLSNLFGYPTDCPQREKNGWTADAHLALEVGLYNFDVITIYEKWMDDFVDVQKSNGVLPCIVPTDVWGYDWANGVDWTSAVVLIPWGIYQYYGDDSLIRKMYEPMKRYVDYISGITTDYLTDWGLGDWIPVKSTSNVKLTTSIYYYVDVDILSRVAGILGKKEDSEHYRHLADSVRASINKTFLDEETGIYAGGTQTELAMPLYWNVVPEQLKNRVAANLNQRVMDDDCHLDVGVLGCKALLGALSDNGYIDTAYRVATQDTYPSWGYWISSGATTLRENWRTDVVIDNSHNHIMFGEVGAWLYKSIAGITTDLDLPGFRKTYVNPYFPPDLDTLEVSYDTPLGILRISWFRTGTEISYSLDVPVGMTVELKMPDGEKNLLINGSYQFNWKI